MKKTSLIIVMFLLCRLSTAQTWSALGRGIPPYGNYGGVFALGAYENHIIAGGVFDSAGTIPINDFAAQWNGTSWDSLFSSLWGWQTFTPTSPSLPGWVPVNNVCAFANYNNDLYIGGSIYGIDGIHATNIIKWNGRSWDTLGNGLGRIYNFVYSLAIYNGNLVAGGFFNNSGANWLINNIAMWNGASWESLGSGVWGNPNGNPVYAMAVYNGNLYAAGVFDTADGKPAGNIAMWNGKSWSAVGGGINGGILCLAVYNGELYAGGEFDTAGGQPINNIARWNGRSWSAVGAVLNTSNFVHTLLVYNDNLIVGGMFNSTGGSYANNLASWNGTSWSALTSKNGSPNGPVYSLVSHNGALYVGGNFDSIGGIHANCIAEYCPGNCPINNEIISTTYIVYPNPGYGVFTFQSQAGEPLTANSNIEVYSVLGQKIYSQGITNNYQFTIDLSSYANGVYFYRVTTENGAKIATGKLVKQ